jgi:hypothetical protein
MAYDFSGSGQYLVSSSSTAPVLDEPVSMACWFNADATTADMDLMNLCPDTGTDDGFRLRAAGGTGGDPIQMISREGGAEGSASTSAGFSTGTWHHACGVVSAVDARAAYLDGGSKGTGSGTQDVALAATSKIAVGAYRTDSTFNEFDGKIAECAIWNVALSDEEVLVLAKGYSPLLVRPQSLVFYAPLVRGLLDVRRGATLSATGAAVSDHPRIIMPKKRQPYSALSTGDFALLGSSFTGGQTAPSVNTSVAL